MACLHQPHWEKYCREVVELTLDGHIEPRLEAYKRAGFVPNKDNARKFANKSPIKTRVRELFAEAFEYQDVRLARVVLRIDRVGRANVADYFEKDGRTLKNLKTLPRDLSDAIESIEWIEGGTDEDGNPKFLPKLKLKDANQANLALLKHLGGLPEAPSGGTQVNIFSQLSIDDQRALAEALDAIPAGTAASGGQIEGEYRQA